MRIEWADYRWTVQPLNARDEGGKPSCLLPYTIKTPTGGPEEGLPMTRLAPEKYTIPTQDMKVAIPSLLLGQSLR